MDPDEDIKRACGLLKDTYRLMRPIVGVSVIMKPSPKEYALINRKIDIAKSILVGYKLDLENNLLYLTNLLEEEKQWGTRKRRLTHLY